jgi:transposase
MKDPSIEVWAEDEVHFQRAASLIRTWAPIGKQPHVLSASTRQKIGFFGAVGLKTGRLLTQEASTFNAETFYQFLCFLLRSTRGRILLILDNISYHKAQELKPFFNEYQSRLQRAFLPPYSPELNPTERIWRITRRKVTHNRYFPSIGDLKQAVVNQFTQWEHPNKALKALCATI